MSHPAEVNEQQLLALLRELETLDAESRAQLLGGLSSRTLDEIKHLWRYWARPEQLPPPRLPNGKPWITWLALAGRGWGKTRAGAEFVISEARKSGAMRIALVGITPDDVRETMILGVSGIIPSSPRSFMPRYNQTLGKLQWPNGAEARVFSSETPRKLRGPQFHAAWGDELCAWSNAQETWDMLTFGMRLRRIDGIPPRVMVTTTPKPMKLLKTLMNASDTYISRGSTYDNAANLSTEILEKWKRQYEGTRLGDQELNAVVRDDVEGALWSSKLIDATRIRSGEEPEMKRIIVAVDPAVTSNRGSDETGICVAGEGIDGRYYVLGDFSGIFKPFEWANRVGSLYEQYRADRIIAEANNGGSLVEENLRLSNRNLPITMVHASRGKVARAEPICALYEQGKVVHVGRHEKLEEQMLQFTGQPSGSDDRVDALVWALYDLSSFSEFTYRLF